MNVTLGISLRSVKLHEPFLLSKEKPIMPYHHGAPITLQHFQAAPGPRRSTLIVSPPASKFAPHPEGVIGRVVSLATQTQLTRDIEIAIIISLQALRVDVS